MSSNDRLDKILSKLERSSALNSEEMEIVFEEIRNRVKRVLKKATPSLCLATEKRLGVNFTAKVEWLVDNTIHAHMSKDPRGVYFIEISSGLMLFVEQLAMLITSSIQLLDTGDEPPSNDLPKSTQQRMLSEMLDAFWNEQEEKVVVTHPLLKSISGRKYILFEKMVEGAVSFALAHEFGHILVDEHWDLSTEYLKVATEIVSLNGSMPMEGLEQWAVEIAADFIAIELAQESWRSQNGVQEKMVLDINKDLSGDQQVELAMWHGGMFLFLLGCALLNKWAKKQGIAHERPEMLQYPPFHLRVRAFKTYCHGRQPGLERVARQFETVLKAMATDLV